MPSAVAEKLPGKEVGDPLIGAVVGGAYQVMRLIGRGGTADLYVAEHLRLKRPLVLKVLRPHREAGSMSRARFEREAAALSRIRSPHVLQVLDLVAAPDGRPCVVSELLEGESLQEHAERRGRLEPLAATRVAQQVASALSEAHASGVIHGDVKPSNVYLVRTSTGAIHVKVIDFGVARLRDRHERLTRNGALVGTPPYMAPEQAQGKPADEQTDVYGVGALLYRLLTGVPPHDAPTPAEVLHEIERADPRRPGSLRPELPSAACAIIEKALSRDPSHRFHNMGALAESLAHLADTLDETDRRQPTLTRIEREQRWARPLALLSAALSVGCVVLTMAIGLELLRGSQDGLALGLTGAGAAAATGRSIQRRWRSSTALVAWSRSVLSGLLTGSSVFGALSLLSETGFVSRQPLSWLLIAIIAIATVAKGKAVIGHRKR